MFVAPGVVLPLNPDPLLTTSLQLANTSVFVNTFGTLDASGRALARFASRRPGWLAPLAGIDLDFAYVLLNPLDFASNPVRVTITP